MYTSEYTKAHYKEATLKTTRVLHPLVLCLAMSAGKFNIHHVIYRTVVSYVESSGSLMGYRAMH